MSRSAGRRIRATAHTIRITRYHAAMRDIHQLRRSELARLRAAQTEPTDTTAPAETVASAGVSERKRADILSKIDAIEAQMRAQWTASAPDNTLKR